MSINLTDQFIEDLYDLGHQDLSASVSRQVKRCLLDYLGVALAGAFLLKDKNEKVLNYLGDGNGKATVFGFKKKTNIESAVFLNGLSAHAAELDDGVRFGMIHPGAPVFSSILPVAESEDVTVSDLFKGVVTGYEAAVRLSSAMQPSHYKCGYHPTATCGAIGAAMAVAAMLGFSKPQMKDALSAAIVSAAGTLKVLEDRSELKPFNVGQAARNGLIAAVMARADFAGPDDALSGNAGFFSMMAEEYDRSLLNITNDNPLGIQQVYVKPYAACRHAHPAIEATLRARLNQKIVLKDITEIRITTYDGVIGKHDHKTIFGVSSAKMSIPFSVAVALKTGRAGIEEFTDENINDPDVVELINKVDIIPNKTLSDMVPEKRTAIVDISTLDGARYTERIDDAKGEPENPLSDKEIAEKFLLLSTYAGKTEKESSEIIQTVWGLINSMRNLFRIL